MRITFWSILMLVLIFGTTLHAASVTQTRALVVTNVNVIDATGAPSRPDMTVVISNGRISAIGPSGLIKAPPGSEVIDASGKYLIPGRWDMHLHLTITPDQAVTCQVIAPTLTA
ncbi:MAG: amidohydrolase family protein [Blastocatellia bacterium]